MIRVEVVYALPQNQRLIALELEEGCSALTAVQRSGLLQQFPEIDLHTAVLGIFGKRLEDPATTALCEGDRVEIYRPLLIDPKAVRRQRAARSREDKNRD